LQRLRWDRLRSVKVAQPPNEETLVRRYATLVYDGYNIA
jgi:hypothetical protein